MNPVITAMKPIRRSRLRLFAGKRYFIWKRYWKWITARDRLAKELHPEALPYEAASHATPLLRSLRNVDMQLQYNKITNLRLAVARLDSRAEHGYKVFQEKEEDCIKVVLKP